jgi:tight adherence protein B
MGQQLIPCTGQLTMRELLAGSTVTIAFALFATPRFFRIADTYEIQRRLRNADLVHGHMKTMKPLPRYRHTKNSTLLDHATLCESLARATRSGSAPHDAILSSLETHRFPHPCWSLLYNEITAMHSCEESLGVARDSAEPQSNDAQCLALLESAMVHGNFVPAALDHASSVLRERAACRAELAVAASQAQLSARLLSALPFLFLGGAIVLSSQFRAEMFTPIVVVSLCIGFFVNRLGWRWISSLISRAVGDEPDDIGELTEHLCVSLRAGLSMTQACERWHAVSILGSLVADLINSGLPLEEALIPLATTHHISGKNLGHTIVEAERDGLPIIETVARLASDHRIERRRHVDTRIRQLPTRLSLPLVLCVLPSFLLLSVAPLVLASLSQLSLSLPSVTQ